MRTSDSTAYRLAVASRVAAAVGGGYALTVAASVFLARALPLSKANAVMTSTLLSFCLYTAAVLWAFAARSASRAWLGVLAPTLLFGCSAWMVGSSS